MAIIIERTITINNDKATLDKPIYFYVGDGNITCLFTIKEIGKTARFGKVNDSNIIQENDSIDYGEARIYKPNKDHAETTRAEIIGDSLKIEFNFDNIDEYSEAGVHKLQIHLYDNATGDRNRLTIPPIDINVLMPIGVESTLVDGALVDHSILEAQAEDLPTFDKEGNYNKTDWQTGDIITKNKLNKIEDALYEINAADDNFVTEEDLDTKLAGKANVAHNHTGYATTTQLNAKANTNHTHTGYATTTHTHSDYATKTELANKADINHTHSEYPIGGDYATKDELAGKADINHTHSEYAAINHNHNEYLTEVPTTYATKTYVRDYVNDSGFITSIPSSYITETELENELAAKGYASEDYVIRKIGEAQLGGGESGDPSELLKDYATIAQLNTKSDKGHTHDERYLTQSSLDNYATKQYVDNAIEGIGGGGGNANIDDNSISLNTVYSSSKVNDLVTQLSNTDTQLNTNISSMSLRLTSAEVEILALKAAPPCITEEEVDEKIAAAQLGGDVDLSDYATKDYVDTAIDNAQLGGDGNSADLSEYAKKTDNVSTFTNDARYISSTGTEIITRIEIVTELPETEEEGVLYIVKG